ncbi:MAG: hypothetical protein SPH89_00460 [Candidatus Limisoma sp.]|nr:hypothetical protein [Candidatus Limisoma sp.]
MPLLSRRLCKAKIGFGIAEQIGANEHPHRAEGTMWIVCVGDAPVVVNPTLSIGDA